jgi:hypothetical protein
MSSWLELLNEIKTAGVPHDRGRRKYIKQLSDKAGRNVISTALDGLTGLILASKQ